MARTPLEQLKPDQAVIICGTRELDEAGWQMVWTILDELRPAFVIQGGARGVDAAAKGWAEARDVPCATVHAPWTKHPRAGGPIRNGWMLRLKPDACIAFPGGDGTGDMVGQAKAAGVDVIEPFPGRRAKRVARK